MKRLELVEFKRLVANVQWDINFRTFCQRAAFSEDSYAEDKWQEFQKLARSLAQFDDNTLSQILDVE